MREDLWNEDDLAQVLNNDGVVVMPTDTIYGIVGRAFSSKVIDRIYKLRKRTLEKPCIILIGDIKELKKFGIELSPKQEIIVNEYWPGPVSIVIDCPSDDLFQLHRGTKTLAFRMPSPEGLRNLLNKTGPIIAPSANLEGRFPSRSIEDAYKYFGKNVDKYVDGGTIHNNPSLILRLFNDDTTTIIRS